MRPTTDADAEAWVLLTEPGRALLAEVAEVRLPRPAELARWRKRASPQQVAAAARMAAARRRGAAKFSRAADMWFEPVGLEQATAEPIARHKAARFTANGPIIDLGCGIGGDTVALAAISPVLAVDLDPGMCRRCAWNAGVYGVAERVQAVRGRAERLPIPPGAWVHIDPDGRARSGPRAFAVRDLVPGPEFLQALPSQSPGGAIKLSPMSDFDSHFDASGFEVELISLGRECKQAVVWFGALATCRRRATHLPSGVTWTDRDGPEPSHNIAGHIAEGAWVFAPDPALTRAGLLDRFAAAHDLRRIEAGIDLLTGPNRVASPFLAAFAVVDVFALDLKRLRREVAARGLGPLEIKVRGLDLRPETLRTQLRPQGPNPATLILIGGAGPSRAILAHREKTHQDAEKWPSE
jgi:SAM-dependent methyltransferase